MKSANALKVLLAMFVLATVWVGFQLATHRHTGILRTGVAIRRLLNHSSISSQGPAMKATAPAGSQRSVHLSWKASTSAVAGYNVYRRTDSGPLIKINSTPVTGTSYVDSSVQPGHIYYYVAKAVGPTGRESLPSNEAQALVSSP